MWGADAVACIAVSIGGRGAAPRPHPTPQHTPSSLWDPAPSSAVPRLRGRGRWTHSPLVVTSRGFTSAPLARPWRIHERGKPFLHLLPCATCALHAVIEYWLVVAATPLSIPAATVPSSAPFLGGLCHPTGVLHVPPSSPAVPVDVPPSRGGGLAFDDEAHYLHVLWPLQVADDLAVFSMRRPKTCTGSTVVPLYEDSATPFTSRKSSRMFYIPVNSFLLY